MIDGSLPDDRAAPFDAAVGTSRAGTSAARGSTSGGGPSALGRQSQAYEIVVAERDDTRSALAAAAHGQGSISTAPVVLVFFANPRRNVAQYGGRGESLYCVQDATIAAAYAQLAAATQGLGSCWVGAFDEAAVREVLRAPERLRPVVMLPIGHAAEEPHRTSRRGIDHLVWHEHF